MRSDISRRLCSRKHFRKCPTNLECNYGEGIGRGSYRRKTYVHGIGRYQTQDSGGYVVDGKEGDSNDVEDRYVYDGFVGDSTYDRCGYVKDVLRGHSIDTGGKYV